MAKNLTIGEGYVSQVDLVDSDGNSVTLAAVQTGMTVDIRQYNVVKETFTWGDSELSAGDTATKLKITTNGALTATFREGSVIARPKIVQSQISLPDYHILTMYLQLPQDDETVTEVIDHWRGSYDASGNVAPSTGGAGTGGAILAGDEWVLSVAGTLFGTPRNIGDRITALVNNPGQTSGNWSIQGVMV